MSKNSLFLVVGALFFFSSAQAQEGLYVRGEVGRSDIDEVNIKDSNNQFGIDVGWRFTEHFGAELGFRDLGKFTGTISAPTTLNADALTVALSGRANLHVGETQGIYLDGRFGLANFDVKGTETFAAGAARRFNESGSRPFFSVGVGYDMTDNFGMAISYSRYQVEQVFSGSVGAASKTIDVDLPTLGITAEFRFN
jgi:hypothetical protein